MAVLPSERDTILLVDGYAVATGLIANQLFQAIASGNREILELGSSVEELQLPLRTSPKVMRDPPSGTGVSVAEQIRRGLISKRVNHVIHLLHV
jgi:hypothetical protein